MACSAETEREPMRRARESVYRYLRRRLISGSAFFSFSSSTVSKSKVLASKLSSISASLSSLLIDSTLNKAKPFCA